ncbi:hypothetical protein PQR75_26315 [Paraburkholderia fungorum]|uniref:hypothetical protein n=1 Tax=Paraburkholderia fungorum TaxID=134537 RepID=UPI0038B74612
MNVQELIDSIEQDIDRIRNLDPALRASLIAKFGRLNEMVAEMDQLGKGRT